MKTGERFTDIRDRIQKAMDLQDDVFEKYKVAVVFNAQVFPIAVYSLGTPNIWLECAKFKCIYQ